ncbi:hypothetical protein M0812_08286 [Anaeramoeba flamelloides]|uniref:Peptidase M20 dimerisation domain-containing protein n=1 Tax=Anaeramoeba flamelloides TaxID=1746091 RepID=A0AAV8A168_9EUKA|nr:hypothetical protein M0812_08286 [Anaeramoeba flamelloides]
MFSKSQQEEISRLVNKIYEEKAIESIKENIRIPVLSPEYDPDFLTNGLIDKTINMGKQWLENLGLEGLETKIVKCPKTQTPLLYALIKSNKIEEQKKEEKEEKKLPEKEKGNEKEKTHEEEKEKEEKIKNILLYSHADRMPVNPNLWTVTDPREPIVKDNKLYGRGTCDDVYGLYANSIVIYVLQQMGLPHDNIHLILESEEESGSQNLFSILDTLDLPDIDFAVIMDGGGPNDEHFWVTTSVRGLINGVLSVDVLKSGVHSGDGTGIIPSPFRISRLLLNRIEDEKTGEIKLKELNCEIDEEMETMMENNLPFLQQTIEEKFPWVDKEKPIVVSHNKHELVRNNFFGPGLEITGCEGLPNLKKASNVCRAQLKLKLSIRLPPVVEIQPVIDSLKQNLEKNPPYGANVEYKPLIACQGWLCKTFDKRIESAANRASLKFFGAQYKKLSFGTSLPLLYNLSLKFPNSQILLTGAGTPDSSPHGPNEFIELSFLKNCTSCVTQIIGELSQWK